MRHNDVDMDEPLTCDIIAEITNTRRSLVVRLAQQGLLEVVTETSEEPAEPILPRRTIMRLRRMKRLRHDLGVNFAGAAIILDLMERIRTLNRELTNARSATFDDF
ncbi:MAG TPA: chaperone modulator CbpM [Pyrinomonadaceae bacterium]|nr:chaperone modulator CbpM [Pyrinomonadaceae bacterium]